MIVDSKHEDLHREEAQYLIDDAYAYAWVNSIYPIQHDSDGSVADPGHMAFSDLFVVSKERAEEISDYMDERWADQQQANPTYWEIVDHFGKESRSAIHHVARYFYLLGLFDEDFWNDLQEGSITKPLTASEIHL